MAVINQSYGGNNEKGWVKAFKDLLGVKMKWGYNSSGIRNQYWDRGSGKRISHEEVLKRISRWHPNES